MRVHLIDAADHFNLLLERELLENRMSLALDGCRIGLRPLGASGNADDQASGKKNRQKDWQDMGTRGADKQPRGFHDAEKANAFGFSMYTYSAHLRGIVRGSGPAGEITFGHDCDFNHSSG
jgi:hypothetical protein